MKNYLRRIGIVVEKLGLGLTIIVTGNISVAQIDQFPEELVPKGASSLLDQEVIQKASNCGTAPCDSRFGGSITPRGDVRFFIIFAGFTNDNDPGTLSNPNPNFNDGNWPAESPTNPGNFENLPNWVAGDQFLYDSYSDFNLSNTDFSLSNYFHQMSQHSPNPFRIVGKVFPKRINITASDSINDSSAVWRVYTNMVYDQLDADPDFNAFNFSLIDQRENVPGYHFDNSTTSPDSNIDYTIIVWRFNGGGNPPFGTSVKITAPGTGGGYASIVNRTFTNGMKITTGFTAVTGLGGVAGNRFLFRLEFAHNLINMPHVYGANNVVGQYYYGGYGWGMENGGPTAFNCMTGFARWFLGWTDLSTGSGNVNSDITSASDLPTDGIFTIRDFISTGDALRIRLPNVSGDQNIWIENHQGVSNFDDRQSFITDGKGVLFDPSPRGVVCYYENISSDFTMPLIFSSGANAMRVIDPAGNFDYNIPDAPFIPSNPADQANPPDNLNPKEWWGNVVYDFTKSDENPLAGQSTTSQIRGDFGIGNVDEINVSTNANGPSPMDHYPFLMEDGNFLYGPLCSNIDFPAGQKLGMGTNPTISNMPKYSKNTEKLNPFILHGLSVEVLSYNQDGSATVKVIFDDVDVNNDTRWTGFVHLPPPTGSGPTDYSTNIMSGVTVHIDKSGTANRETKTIAGDYINLTEFTMLPNSYFHMESNSTVIVDNGSTFIIQQDAKLEVHANSEFIVRNGSKLIIEDGGELFVHDDGLVIIEAGAELIFENQTAGKGLALGGSGGPQTAELRIEGTLTTDDNITLRFSGDGFINFSGANAALNVGNPGIISLHGQDDNDLLMLITNNADITIGKGIVFTDGVLKVTNNAILRVDTYDFIVASNGTLQADAGGQVELNGAAILKIFSNGQTVIGSGGTLDFKNGASIFLEDDPGLIEIDGTLIIDNNTDFTFTGNGFVRLTSASVQPGSNSRILLEGSGNTDKVLEIVGATILPAGLDLFRILNGKALFQGGRLDVNGPLMLLNADFIGPASNQGIGVFGQINTVITSCNFDNVPIVGQLYVGGNSLSISNSQIFNSPVGLHTFGTAVHLNNVFFFDNDIGWKGEQLEYTSFLNNCDFTNNYSGIEVLSATGAVVRLNNVDILAGAGGSVGIVATDVTLDVKCSSVKNHTFTAFLITNNAVLNMSTSTYAGYVDASGSKMNTIYASDAQDIYLDNGYNNLAPDEQFALSIATGNFLLPCPSYPKLSLDIDADNNKWHALDLDPPVFQSADYTLEAYSCDIRLIDNSPNGLETCDSQNPDPCSTPPLVCKSNLGINCLSCPVLSTPDFSGVLLNEAIDIAYNAMELIDSLQDDIAAVNLFSQILTSDLDRSDPDVAYLVRFAYNNMKQALRNTFTTGKISEADNAVQLHTSLQQMRMVQDSLSDPVTEFNFLERFYLDLDIADVYRLAGKRDTSLEILSAIDNCFLRHKDRIFLKRQILFTETENLVITGQISSADFIRIISEYEQANATVISSIDSTATVDYTVSIGLGTTIGAGTNIESGVTIGDNTSIGSNVTIDENVVIGEGSIIGDNTAIKEGTHIGSGTTIGESVTIDEIVTIGNKVVIENNVEIAEQAVIGSRVSIGAFTTLNEEVSISDGSTLGNSNIIDEKVKIGTNVIIRNSVEIGEEVAIGDGTIIGSSTTIDEKSQIGAAVRLAESINIGEEVEICDNHTVNTNVPDEAVICSPGIVSPPTLVGAVVYDCDFAKTFAKTYSNFFNGFTAENVECLNSPTLLLADAKGIRFKPEKLSNSYLWNFGDCITSTDESPVHTYTNAGIYIVTLVQDFNCVPDTLIGSITVYPNPKIKFTALGMHSCDSAKEVTFDRITNLGSLSVPPCATPHGSCNGFSALDSSSLRIKYHWGLGASQCTPFDEIYTYPEISSGSDTDTTVVCIYATEQSYTITLAATLEKNNIITGQWETVSCTNTFENTIFVGNRLKANFSTEPTLCAKEDVLFTDKTSGGIPPFTYSWDFGNGSTSASANPSVVYLTDGVFEVSLTVNDAVGCVNTIDVKVVINPVKTIKGVLVDNQFCPIGIEPNTPIVIVDQARKRVNTVSTAMTDNAGNFEFLANEISTLDTVQQYSLAVKRAERVEVIDAGLKTIRQLKGDCVFGEVVLEMKPLKKDTIIIRANPDTITAMQSVTDQQGNIIQIDVTAQDFETTKLDPQGNIMWNRSFDGFAGGTDQASAVCLDFNGNSYVTGKSWNGVDFDYLTIKYDPFGNQMWTSRFDGIAGGEDMATAICTDNQGNVYVTGISFNGTSFDFVTIKQLQCESFNQAKSGGSNNTETMEDGPGILSEEVEQFRHESINYKSYELVIYPNPTTGLIKLTGLPQKLARIAVYNVLGEFVYDETLIASRELLVDLSSITKGIYFFEVSEGETIFRRKIIKL